MGATASGLTEAALQGDSDALDLQQATAMRLIEQSSGDPPDSLGLLPCLQWLLTHIADADCAGRRHDGGSRSAQQL